MSSRTKHRGQPSLFDFGPEVEASDEPRDLAAPPEAALEGAGEKRDALPSRDEARDSASSHTALPDADAASNASRRVAAPPEAALKGTADIDAPFSREASVVSALPEAPVAADGPNTPPTHASQAAPPPPLPRVEVTRAEPVADVALPDAEARAYATDPRRNVVLEASAGTGKTSVLVARYLNLLSLDVDPSNILAITFTRKAAAEMRERIVTALRRQAAETAEGRTRWMALRDRLNDVSISTIDAFCYGVLREFPLEAGLDPAFTLADETEVARLVEEALDHAIRI